MKTIISETIDLRQNSRASFMEKQIFKNDNITTRAEIPAEYDFSDLDCRTLSPSLEIWNDSLEFRQTAEMSGECRGDFYCLSFCLSGEIEWEELISNSHFSQEKGEGAFYHIKSVKEICRIESGVHLDSCCVMVRPDHLEDIISALSLHNRLFQQEFLTDFLDADIQVDEQGVFVYQ